MTEKKSVTIVFGESAVRKHADGEVNITKLSEFGSVGTFEFDTDAEMSAFMLGVAAAEGWLDACIYEENEMEITNLTKHRRKVVDLACDVLCDAIEVGQDFGDLAPNGLTLYADFDGEALAQTDRPRSHRDQILDAADLCDGVYLWFGDGERKPTPQTVSILLLWGNGTGGCVQDFHPDTRMMMAEMLRRRINHSELCAHHKRDPNDFDVVNKEKEHDT